MFLRCVNSPYGMSIIFSRIFFPVLLVYGACFLPAPVAAQTSLLLNGNFEDINTCTEYNSECGVEAWFYLNNVKVQMLANEEPELYPYIGNNSFGLFFTWTGYQNFSPILGTLLPCKLQKNARYVFRGLFKKPKLDKKLIFWPGVVLGENFYVPRRPFAAAMHPDSITQIKYLPKTGFYQFEYSFVATGREKYLTFGTYITEDTVRSKNIFIGSQSVSVVLDNFELLPTGPDETDCSHFVEMKEAVYNYNYRHKEMDYSLYSKGDLNIDFSKHDSLNKTVFDVPLKDRPVKIDTLKLGDVFFDFNKSKLKQEGLSMLAEYFGEPERKTTIDSIYIEGHTDSVGTDSRNLKLSRERCESVAAWMRRNEVLPGENIQIHPFGESRPIASNSTSQGRARNRRVEIIVFRRQKN
jgi:outer membrane protein OmpA-like peptidoglycan-associated protein